MSTTPHGEQLTEEGIVITIEEGTPRRAQVMMVANDACETCSASSVCKPEDAERRTLEAADPIGVEPGDRVMIAVAGGAVLKASLLIYGLPLVMLLIGVGGSMWLLPSTLPGREPIAFALGIILVALALVGVHLRERARRQAGKITLPAVVVKKV